MRDLFRIWKDVMFDPVAFYKSLPKYSFRKSNEFYLKVSAVMILAMVIFMAIFIGIILFIVASSGTGIEGVSDDMFPLIWLGILVGLFVLSPILLLLQWGYLYVGAAIMHLFVLLFGGKKGYKETVTTVAYSSAPAPLSLIPLVGYAAGVYSIVLVIMGLRERQKMSTGQSVAAVLIPVFVYMFFIGLVYFIWIFSTLY
jgi:hypothetical protein